MQNNNIINTMEELNFTDTLKSEQQPKSVIPTFEEKLQTQQNLGQHVPYSSNKAIVDNNLKHIYEAKDGGDTDYAYGLVINELRDRLKIDNDLYDWDTLGELYFGKKVDIKEATEHFSHLYELQQQSEANKLKHSEERAIWEKETPERKAEILESNPDYENRIFADRYNDAMAYLNNLSTKDKKFVFEFINAEGTRNAIVEQYKDEFARIQVEEPDRYAKLIGAITTLNPYVDSNWLFRGFERFWESLGDSVNAFDYSQEYGKFGVNEHRIYDYVMANGGMDAFFDAQGNYLEGKEAEINQEIKRLQDDEFQRLNEYAGVNGGVVVLEKEDKKYTNKEIYELAKKGAEFRHKEAIEQVIRNLKSTNYGKYSGVSEFLSKGVTTLLDSGLYVGGTATLTALTKNPYISSGLMWKLMYERSNAENIKDFTLNGGLTYDQAKTTAMVISAFDATFETIENYFNIKVASPSDYLLKTVVKDIKANVVHKKGWSAIFKEYLRDTGGELLIAEYPQAFTTYLAKEYLIRNYGANYSSDENAKELGDRLWEATILTPFVTGVYSQFGNYRISQEVQQATGKGLIRGLFDSDIRKGTPKDYYDNQAQATGAMMQVEKATSDIQNKYNPDFLEAYKEAKTEEEKQSVVNKEFPNEDDRKTFYKDLKVVQKAETDAFISYNRTIVDAVNKHREQSQKLKEEAESLNVQSASDLGIEQNGEDKFELVNNFLDKFGGRENVEIYNTVEDMPFNIKNEFKKGGDGAKGAFYIKDNKIYLIKDRLNDKYDALTTLVHERTHFVRELLKSSNTFNDLMDETTRLMGGVEFMRLSLPEAYRNNRDDIIVEEYLARVCERVILEQELSKKDKGVWNSIKNFFKNWFFGEDGTLSSKIDKRIAEIGKKIFDLANESIVVDDKKQSEETGQKAKAKTQKDNKSVEKVEAKVEIPNQFKGISKLVEDLDKTLPQSYKISEDFKKALEVLNKANEKRMKLDAYLLTNGKNEKLSDLVITLADYLDKSKKGSGLFDILKRYGKSAEAVVEASDYYPLFRNNPLTKQQLLEMAKDKHVWSIEEARKSVYDFIDSIPDEDATNKVEILEEYELESLRDRDLEYLATYGNKQAERVLMKRFELSEFERTPLLRRLLDEGIKLPTPKSMKNLGGDLSGKMQAIWDSMPFNLKMKFFRKQNGGSGDLDTLAHDLGFDSENDFITQFSDEITYLANSDIKLSTGNLQRVDYSEAQVEAQRQYDEVLAKYKDTPLWMKAPNGQPTNLTERQWIQVRTANFKNWFGDWENDPANASKIVDENGEPLVVYHGTKTGGFTEFDTTGKYESKGTGSWFSSKREVAETYTSNDSDFNLNPSFNDLIDYGLVLTRYIVKDKEGNERDISSQEFDKNYSSYEYVSEYYELFDKNNSFIGGYDSQEDLVADVMEDISSYTFNEGGIYGVFLNIRNPEVWNANDGGWSEITTGYYVLDSDGDFVEGFSTKEEALDFISKQGGGMSILEQKETSNEIVRQSREADFDGAIIKNVLDEGSYGRGYHIGDDYVAFKPTQIKSATDNVGTYDSTNPDIRFSLKADTRTQEEKDALNQKFRDLYDQYKNGDQDAYKQAVELVKAEAERKGYAVKVYHGTGADGFNVADATSLHEENGEGNQAHGAGLYMAVSRETAEGYKNYALLKNENQFLIAGKRFREYKTPNGLNRFEIMGLCYEVAKFGKEYFEHQEKMYRGFYENAKKRAEKPYKNPRTADKYYNEMEDWRRDIKRYELFRRFLSENNITFDDIKFPGHVFNWFTNLNEDNTLDADKPFTKQHLNVKKALRKLFKNEGKKEYGFNDLTKIMKTGYVNGNPSGRELMWEVASIKGYSKLEVSQLLLKYGIKGLTYDGRQDGRCYVSFEGGSTVKLQDPFTFDDNGELIPLTERFDESNPDMRFSIEEQIETPQFKRWFGNSKVVDENGKPLHVYHGTSRGDRVGDIFDPKRATSGPMAFFTDNKDIATNYATDKNDTSIDADGLFDSYDSRFFFINDDGQKMPLSEAWLKIPFDKRKTITEKAKHITLDDDGENAIYDKNAKDGAGSFSFNLMEARNNVFQALYAEWLDSGYLMRDDEVKFLEVLKLAGVENVEYLDPYKKEPKVYDVFLRIEKPFDTSKISKTDIAGLKRAAKKAQKSYNPENSRKVDSWDKNSISPEDWIKKLERDLEIWKTYSWIQIPDFVTDYLKSKGYDGIKDKGGKNTDIGHTVWIPFSSNQIKDATGENSGDFSLDNPSIKWKSDFSEQDFSEMNARLEKVINSISDKTKQHIEIIRQISDKEAEYLQAMTGLDLNGYSHAVDNYAILHILKKHGTPKEFEHGQIPITFDEIKKFPIIVSNYDNVEYVGKSNTGRDTIRFEKSIGNDKVLVFEEMRTGKKLLVLLTMYIQKKKKLTSNANASSLTPETLSTSSDLQASENNSESQVKKLEGELRTPDARFLVEQDPDKHPIAYASIQMAKYMLYGKGEGFLRNVPSRLIEKLLPSERYSPFQQEKAVDMANRIAEKIAKKRQDFSDELALNREIKITQNDLFWDDYIKRISNEFISSGEWLNRLITKARQNIAKDLENIKPLSDEELGFDTVNAIENAINEEPKRKPKTTKPEEDPEDDIETETLGETTEGHDNELTNVDMELTPMDIRSIVEKIHNRIKEIGKRKHWDDETIQKVYRNTLVDQLKKGAKQLTYGKEREAIISKINELATKGYAIVEIEDGDRAGQRIDNYTLRAEHIALRIFKRGVRDTKEELLAKFDKLLKHAKAPKTIERADKRKMDAKVEARAYKIKQIAYMSEDVIDKEIQEATNRINSTETSASDDYYVQLIGDVNYLEDLQRFGALRDKTRTEIADAVDWLENRLKEEVEAQEEKVEKLKAEAGQRRKIFLDAINENERNAEFDSKTRKYIRKLFNSSSTFKDLLLGLGRASTGETYKAFSQLVNKMMDDCYVATTNKGNEVFQKQQAFLKKVSEIYKKNERDALKHILQTRKDLQEFSVQAKPMSVSTLLQRLSMAEQGNYRYNTFIHCCKRTSEYEVLENRLNELYEIEEKSDADWLEIHDLEAKLEAFEKTAVEEYANKIREKLSKEDLQLLDWFRNFYKEERPSLSDANEIITGLGIPEADELYTPMKMLREGGTNEKHQVVAIVPKSMTPRVPNSLDMDESYGIVDMWNNRIAENAHYKAFSQLNIEWRGIFAHADFHKAVKQKFGDDVLKQLLDHFNDIMSVRLVDNNKIELVDKVNGFFAITALGFNFGSGVRQLTGIPIFANFIGLENAGKYIATAWFDEGRKAMVEIFKSDTAKRRMGMGNNQAIVEALENLDENKFWSWYKRYSMIFNKLGDILPIMVIGQGIYRAKFNEYIKTMPLEEAKTRAMNEMWAIAEASQQSPSVMNMGVINRRGGSLGKVLTLFTSSPQLMLSREVEAINRAVATFKKYKANPTDKSIMDDYLEARDNALKTIFINHFLSQGGYLLATWLWKALLGDDWDEKDWWAMLLEVLAGPFASLVVFGRFLTALNSNYGKSDIAPISALGNAIGGFSSLIWDTLSLDGEEILEDLDKIAKTLNAPYRDVRRIYKNATDEKEGDIW